jgi:hypothetical protein
VAACGSSCRAGPPTLFRYDIAGAAILAVLLAFFLWCFFVEVFFVEDFADAGVTVIPTANMLTTSRYASGASSGCRGNTPLSAM